MKPFLILLIQFMALIAFSQTIDADGINKGVELIRNEEYGKAIKYFKKPSKNNIPFYEASYFYGLAYYFQDFNIYGKTDKAIDAFSYYINYNPNTSKGFYRRGICYQKIGYQDSAITDFEKCIQLEPLFADAYFGLALSNHHLAIETIKPNEYYIKAIENYTFFIELSDSNNVNYKITHFLRGVCKEILNDGECQDDYEVCELSIKLPAIYYDSPLNIFDTLTQPYSQYESIDDYMGIYNSQTDSNDYTLLSTLKEARRLSDLVPLEDNSIILTPVSYRITILKNAVNYADSTDFFNNHYFTRIKGDDFNDKALLKLKKLTISDYFVIDVIKLKSPLKGIIKHPSYGGTIEIIKQRLP